jgi:hypothetical protein
MFSPGTPVSSTNKIDRHDIIAILLEVALNQTNQKTIFEGISLDLFVIHQFVHKNKQLTKSEQ